MTACEFRSEGAGAVVLSRCYVRSSPLAEAAELPDPMSHVLVHPPREVREPWKPAVAHWLSLRANTGQSRTRHTARCWGSWDRVMSGVPIHCFLAQCPASSLLKHFSLWDSFSRFPRCYSRLKYFLEI